MPPDPEAGAVGPFGNDGVIAPGTRAYKELREAGKPWVTVDGVAVPERRVTTELFQGLVRLGRLLREKTPTGVPAKARLRLLRGWVKNDGSSSDDTLRAHWEGRGADLTLKLAAGNPTPAQVAALAALAADKRAGLGYVEVRDEPFGGTTRSVLHVSVARGPAGRLTEPLAAAQQVPDKPEFVASDPSTGALRDGPAGPVAPGLLKPYPQGTGAGCPRMTLEVKRRLVELDGQVKSEWGKTVALRVERAWRPEAPGPGATFYGEGRAAALTVAPAGSTAEDRLGRLGRLAVHAGFPYVRRMPAGDGLPEHVYVSTNDTRGVWGKETADAERALWLDFAPLAEQAFNFWSTFLALTQGSPTVSIDATTRFRFLTLVRAISWQESRHGTVYGEYTHPVRSVMQSGHPADGSWATLSGKLATVESVTLPDPPGPRLSARLWELPGVVTRNAHFPDAADVGRLREPKDGHKDPNFSAATSFFWGTLFLLWKVNGRRGMRVRDDVDDPRDVSDCGDGTWAHVIGGAGDYNARISKDKEHTKYYQELVSDFVFRLILGMPRLPAAPDHLFVTADGRPRELIYWAWDGAVRQQRRSKFGGQFEADEFRRPSVAFAGLKHARVVALAAGQVEFDAAFHRLTLRFPYVGGDWLLHYDGVESALMPDGTAVAAGQPIGVVLDRGKDAQERPQTRVELRMEPVNPPTGPQRVDVMDPVVAAGWTTRVAFTDTAWFPKK